MAVVDGGNLRVYVGGTAVAYATSSTINLTAQVDELAPTSVSDAQFTVVKPRRRSGNIATNALYGTSDNYDFKDLFDANKENPAGITASTRAKELRDRGWKLEAIANALNDEGFKTQRGGVYTSGTVHHLLKD